MDSGQAMDPAFPEQNPIILILSTGPLPRLHRGPGLPSAQLFLTLLYFHLQPLSFCLPDLPLFSDPQATGKDSGLASQPLCCSAGEPVRPSYRLKSEFFKGGTRAGHLSLCTSAYPPTTLKDGTPLQRHSCLGTQRREKIGERTVNPMRGLKKQLVRQCKGRSGREGKVTEGQSQNKYLKQV